MRRRRWFLRGGLVTVLIVTLLVIGRGLGLLGTEGQGTSGSSESAPPPPPTTATQEPVPPASPTPGTAATDAGSANATLPRTGAADAASAANQDAAPTTPESPRTPIDADRIAGLRALAETEAAAGHFGRAAAVLADLQRLLPDGAGAPEVTQLQQVLDAALAAAVETLCRNVADGRVLAARVRLDALLSDGDAAAQAALEAAATSRGWPRLGATELPAAPQAAAPLPADRLVRFLRDGRELTGRVVSALPHEATVRAVEARGVTFPTVPVTAVEPVEVTAAEAHEFALAALAGKDGRLARLWVACGLARAGTAVPPALLALRGLLP